MANRTYLYSASKDLKKLRDLSESAQYPIPLTYQIVLGVDTQMCHSRIWDFKDELAIYGDFEKGLLKYFKFLNYLKTQPFFDKQEIERYEQETKEFFEKNEDRKNDLFFFEPGELIDILATKDFTITDQTNMLFREIRSMSKDIDKILEDKPEDLFRYSNAMWLEEFKNAPISIEPHWTHVTYFSFNKS